MKKICVIPGDGIGPEVIPAAVQVMEKVLPDLSIIEAEAGWGCFQKHGISVPQETLDKIRDCGAALFGAVSSPSTKVAGYRSAILTMRQELGLYANLRPVRSLPGVSSRSDVDMIIVRENTEGMYAGIETLNEGRATATRVITREASLRIAGEALRLAQLLGRKKLSIVHKANVLPMTDGLFRDSVLEVVRSYQKEGLDIQVEQVLVDLAAFRMLSAPQTYDVIVTTNLFGDILSDAAAYWGGGMGLAPSLNVGDGLALAEPVHGSAPDIAGKGIANPIAAILSAALLVRFTWQLPETAARIERAVERFLEKIKIDDPSELKSLESTQNYLEGILAEL
ncbi:MAG: isocitrate dehydrogenase [Anaerolineaceae bacterium]|nr:isocitrate dehydrogenase [Anaerolineaceae bacterium]